MKEERTDNKILVFGGTSDSRELLEALLAQDIQVHDCVATDYGGAMLRAQKGLTLQVGRLALQGMVELMRGGNFACVVDATHPYATEATENIRQAAQDCALPYYRLLREEGREQPDWLLESTAEAVKWLATHPGRIFLTTGSRELAAFTALPDFAERIYLRILPDADSLLQAEELGYQRAHMVAMQGPFSQELNREMMRSFAIDILVSKDGGARGGYEQKIRAARELGIASVVIARPPDEGWPIHALLQVLLRRYG